MCGEVGVTRVAICTTHTACRSPATESEIDTSYVHAIVPKSNKSNTNNHYDHYCCYYDYYYYYYYYYYYCYYRCYDCC